MIQEDPNLIVPDELTKIRIIQRNLVYLSPLPEKYANEDLLKSYDFLGKYGKIEKIILNRKMKLDESLFSAYITFTSRSEARKCIEELDGTRVEGSNLVCTYGTTKYCTFFLKKIACQNNDCMYIHQFMSEKDILSKDQLTRLRHHLHDFKIPYKNMEVLGCVRTYKFLDELEHFPKENEDAFGEYFEFKAMPNQWFYK